MIHPLAQELNEILSSCPVLDLFSDLGKRIFFPKGIISQGAEAKQFGKKANATIGITMNDGLPVTLPSVCRQLPELTTSETVAYAPTAGLPAIRTEWKTKIIEKNPLLEKKSFSLPVVVPGLTAGISYLCDLFLNEGETLLTCNPCWDNYNLIVEARRNAVLKQFEMFSGDAFSGGFNIESFQNVVEKQAETGVLKIILNFPQNPSGYTPTKLEIKQICSILKKIAEKGTKVLVLCDDAYFGLDYEDDIEPQSLFAYLADLHENIVTVKIDGPTKEDYVWGFRCGFLSFAGKALSDAQHDALIKKLMGIIRSSVSCCATPSQSILLKIFDDPELEAEKQVFKAILKGRYDKVRAFIADKQNHPVLTPLPFNSGYFMCFSCRNIDAEKLRCKLLHEYEIGTIAIDGRYLRIAFSSLDKRDITSVYSAIYEAAEKLAGV